MSRPKIAVVCTEYRRNSHADVITGRLLAGYQYEGRWCEPRLDVVSMYTDQVPDNDMSHDLAKQHDYTIYDTVAEALRMGTDSLAVDGVVLIGEHGDYPTNAKGQKLYPRYELYREVVDVFEASGRSVPVFCDKHLSTEWDKAVWMVEQTERHGYRLLTGSVQPLSWRRPPLEFDIGTPVTHALTTFHGHTEHYGFHALEMLQCMVERRAGGETGVAAVHCLEGAPVWEWTDGSDWAPPLLEHALRRSDTVKPGRPRDNCSEPILFLLEYGSGLQGACYILNGHLSDRGFAARVEGVADPVSTQVYAQNVRPFGHHAGTVHYIEELVLTGTAAWPPQRTLLTTGTLEALMDSSYEGNVRLETPHLKVAYDPPPGSRFQGEPPPLEDEIPL
jgi:hypothetical protein